MGSSQSSPYAVAESETPEWRPGEELAASAFVGICFWLFIDLNVAILRTFKRRTGLYYWSLLLGTWGCMVDVVGMTLKYLDPKARRVWGLYTFMLLAGWTVYAPAQLLVLYSRLHLINENPKLQRGILLMILSTLITLILPTWVVVWPAYDPDPRISSVWSPRDAIVERYTQIGFTLTETVVSGVYISSLLKLLKFKSSVRQRRVMMDLIHVNVIAIAFDILIVVLVYLNQLGLSHPIQTCSYALKLKLEFLVLNQLMAVAARGIKKQSWEETRYHHSSLGDVFSAEARRWNDKPSTTRLRPFGDSEGDSKVKYSSTETSPAPALGTTTTFQDQEPHLRPSKPSMGEKDDDIIADVKNHDLDVGPDMNFEDLEHGTLTAPQYSHPKAPLASRRSAGSSRPEPRFGVTNMTFSEDTSAPSGDSPRAGSPHLFARKEEKTEFRKLQSSIHSIRRNLSREHRHRRSREQHEAQPQLQNNRPRERRQRQHIAWQKRHRSAKDAADHGGREEEDDVNVWDRRRGETPQSAPWFKSEVEEFNA